MIRITFMASLALALLGVFCLGIAAGSPAFVDDQGFLVEPFAWMASGRLLLLAATVGGAIAAASHILKRPG